MPVDKHPVFYIGQSADDALTVQKLSGRRLTRTPEDCGRDKNGVVVRWHYSSVVLEFRRVTNWYEVTLMLSPTEAEYTPPKGLKDDTDDLRDADDDLRADDGGDDLDRAHRRNFPEPAE